MSIFGRLESPSNRHPGEHQAANNYRQMRISILIIFGAILLVQAGATRPSNLKAIACRSVAASAKNLKESAGLAQNMHRLKDPGHAWPRRHGWFAKIKKPDTGRLRGGVGAPVPIIPAGMYRYGAISFPQAHHE